MVSSMLLVAADARWDADHCPAVLVFTDEPPQPETAVIRPPGTTSAEPDCAVAWEAPQLGSHC